MANDPFQPPPERRAPEIEQDWANEKAARQAAEQVHSPNPPRRWIWAVVAAILVVGGLIVAGVYVQMHAARPIHRDDVPAGTVEIEVRSKRPAVIQIDDHPIGRAPQAIHVPKRATPLHVSDGRTTKLVVPDHDQTVDFY